MTLPASLGQRAADKPEAVWTRIFVVLRRTPRRVSCLSGVVASYDEELASRLDPTPSSSIRSGAAAGTMFEFLLRLLI